MILILADRFRSVMVTLRRGIVRFAPSTCASSLKPSTVGVIPRFEYEVAAGPPSEWTECGAVEIRPVVLANWMLVIQASLLTVTLGLA